MSTFEERVQSDLEIDNTVTNVAVWSFSIPRLLGCVIEQRNTAS